MYDIAEGRHSSSSVVDAEAAGVHQPLLHGSAAAAACRQMHTGRCAAHYMSETAAADRHLRCSKPPGMHGSAPGRIERVTTQTLACWRPTAGTHTAAACQVSITAAGRTAAHLAGAEPQGPLAGVVLGQDRKHALHRPQHRAVHNHRRLQRLVVRAVLQPKPAGVTGDSSSWSSSSCHSGCASKQADAGAAAHADPRLQPRMCFNASLKSACCKQRVSMLAVLSVPRSAQMEGQCLSAVAFTTLPAQRVSIWWSGRPAGSRLSRAGWRRV